MRGWHIEVRRQKTPIDRLGCWVATPQNQDYQRKFRSQTSDLWTDATAVVRAVREEKASEEKESDEKR